jgi:protein gp37
MMGKNTAIEWTGTVLPDGTIKPGHTWNPWQGCRKVSPGCANCYMYRDKHRFNQDPATVIRSSKATFTAPLKWKEPAKVFVCSWSDFFIEDADDWRDEVWEIMRRTPHLTYLLLTKRPENMASRLPADWPLKNVWLGVTAENDDMLHKRVPVLLKTPAVLRFVSVEPLLSQIDLTVYLSLLNWIICGGESGPNHRPIDTEWAIDIKNQCEQTKTAFFFKQMSGLAEIPEVLNVRQFPQP